MNVSNLETLYTLSLLDFLVVCLAIFSSMVAKTVFDRIVMFFQMYLNPYLTKDRKVYIDNEPAVIEKISFFSVVFILNNKDKEIIRRVVDHSYVPYTKIELVYRIPEKNDNFYTDTNLNERINTKDKNEYCEDDNSNNITNTTSTTNN